MGDDATAPNIVKYAWYDYPKPFIMDLFFIIEDYLGCNLPVFFWRGYANGQRIADVTLKRSEYSFSRNIEIVDEWQDLLRISQCVHFLHSESKAKDNLPLSLEKEYYTFEKAEKAFNEYPRLYRECRYLRHLYDETIMPF